jgi:hypothetical protein
MGVRPYNHIDEVLLSNSAGRQNRKAAANMMPKAKTSDWPEVRFG